MKQKNIIGGRVREGRKRARPPITQRDLVARLQVLGVMMEQSSVSKIESAKRPVLDMEVAALAKALRVSVAWLFEEAER